MEIFRKLVQKEKLAAVINISSAAVEGLLMETGRPKPRILGSFSSETNPAFDFKADFLEREIKKALETTLKALAKKAGPQGPDQVFYLLSSSWSWGQTRILHFADQEPFEVTTFLVSKLKEDEKKLIKNKDWRFIEKEEVKYVLNGYTLENPLGKKTKDFLLYLYLSFAKKNFISEIEALAKRILKTSAVSFQTAPFVGFLGLKSLFCLKDNFLFVDFSEETTEIVLVRDGYPEEMAAFSQGRHSFIRRLASGFNIPIEEAVPLFKQSEENHLSPEEKQKIDNILEEGKGKWLSLFDQALEGMSGNFFMPKRIFFLGSDGFFGYLLGAGETGRFARLGKLSVIKQINQSALASHFVSLPGLTFPQKNLTLIFALFVNKEEEM